MCCTVRRQLFEVLTALAATPRRVPVVVACNKSDLGAKAFNDAFIVKQLEKELCALLRLRAPHAPPCGPLPDVA